MKKKSRLKYELSCHKWYSLLCIINLEIIQTEIIYYERKKFWKFLRKAYVIKLN